MADELTLFQRAVTDIYREIAETLDYQSLCAWTAFQDYLTSQYTEKDDVPPEVWTGKLWERMKQHITETGISPVVYFEVIDD
jgi:hypothetical protein